MTERSKNKTGSKSRHGANLKGLERRTRVSRRTAPRRKNDAQDDAGVAVPQAPAVAGSQPAVADGHNRDAVVADAGEAARLRATLDRMPGCVAVCDNDFVVRFANRALVDLLRGSEAELRKLFPGFDAGQLAGSCVDRLHSDPAWFRAQLDACGTLPQSIHLHLAGLRFAISCSALHDADGSRVGTLLEWVRDPGHPAGSG